MGQAKYCMARNIDMELNLVVGEINRVSPNFIYRIAGNFRKMIYFRNEIFEIFEIKVFRKFLAIRY